MITMEETRKIEEVYPNVGKEIIRVPSETPYCELILETGLWPAKKDFGFQNLCFINHFEI